ncbi:MAG TPA: cation:proton antiporter, partial [Beijerinckiaceae bacterium]|nr:cation:proton antiporter [Beijerinckiaceae bacterium]
MASAASHASFLPPVLVFCTAAVVAVPIFRRLGQSAVLGYLAAGVVIGPFGLSIAQPETVLGVAELGVVLLLFLVGLELKVSRLFSMRRDIFGLGFAQLSVTTLVLAAAIIATKTLSATGALIAAVSLALSATSIALQMLEERGDLQSAYGQRSFAILLFQDLSIAPILALMPLAATAGVGVEAPASATDILMSAGKAMGALAVVYVVGRYGLNPLFRLLAASGAREVMTASALLVVLGAALLMDYAGLSMAMGAFL